jgi:hypothetical protein
MSLCRFIYPNKVSEIVISFLTYGVSFEFKVFCYSIFILFLIFRM